MGYDHLCLTKYFCKQSALFILRNWHSISHCASISTSSAVKGSLRRKNCARDFIVRVDIDQKGATV